MIFTGIIVLSLAEVTASYRSSLLQDLTRRMITQELQRCSTFPSADSFFTQCGSYLLSINTHPHIYLFFCQDKSCFSYRLISVCLHVITPGCSASIQG